MTKNEAVNASMVGCECRMRSGKSIISSILLLIYALVFLFRAILNLLMDVSLVLEQIFSHIHELKDMIPSETKNFRFPESFGGVHPKFEGRTKKDISLPGRNARQEQGPDFHATKLLMDLIALHLKNTAEIRDLKAALQCTAEETSGLRRELDAEREASHSAASASLGMIQKLQAEKSDLQMEIRQQRRIAKVRARHTDNIIDSLPSSLCDHMQTFVQISSSLCADQLTFSMESEMWSESVLGTTLDHHDKLRSDDYRGCHDSPILNAPLNIVSKNSEESIFKEFPEEQQCLRNIQSIQKHTADHLIFHKEGIGGHELSNQF